MYCYEVNNAIPFKYIYLKIRDLIFLYFDILLYPAGQIGVSDLFPCLCTDDDIELIDLKKGKHIDQEKGKHIDQEKGKHPESSGPERE